MGGHVLYAKSYCSLAVYLTSWQSLKLLKIYLVCVGATDVAQLVRAFVCHAQSLWSLALNEITRHGDVHAIIPILLGRGKEDQKFKASLNCMRPDLKNWNQNKKKLICVNACFWKNSGQEFKRQRQTQREGRGEEFSRTPKWNLLRPIIPDDGKNTYGKEKGKLTKWWAQEM